MQRWCSEGILKDKKVRIVFLIWLSQFAIKVCDMRNWYHLISQKSRVSSSIEESSAYYHFHTINGEVNTGCSKLLLFKRRWNNRIDEENNDIIGLIEILNGENEYHNNNIHNIDERSNESKRTGSPFK